MIKKQLAVEISIISIETPIEIVQNGNGIHTRPS
jgi:hypothetical protein